MDVSVSGARGKAGSEETDLVESMRFQVDDHVVGVAGQGRCFGRVGLDRACGLEHGAEVGGDGGGALRARVN